MLSSPSNSPTHVQPQSLARWCTTDSLSPVHSHPRFFTGQYTCRLSTRFLMRGWAARYPDSGLRVRQDGHGRASFSPLPRLSRDSVRWCWRMQCWQNVWEHEDVAAHGS